MRGKPGGMYPLLKHGVVVKDTSLGIAVKVRPRGSKVSTWMDMDHLEKLR